MVNSLIEIGYGDEASSEVLNDNFLYLNNSIASSALTLGNRITNLGNDVGNLSNTVTNLGDTVTTINSNYANKNLSNLTDEGLSVITSSATDSCSKTDLSNTSSAGKETANSWGMPDYSSRQQRLWDTEYIETQNGYLMITVELDSNKSFPSWKLTINNQEYKYATSGDWANTKNTYQYAIPKNTTYKASGSHNTGEFEFYFIPCKGEV